MLPVLAVALDPDGDFLKRRSFKAARAPLGFAAAEDESGTFEDFEVLGDGGRAQRKRLGKLFDGGFTESQASEDRAPGWIGESGEGGAEMVRHLIHHKAN